MIISLRLRTQGFARRPWAQHGYAASRGHFLLCREKKRPATVISGPDLRSADWVQTLIVGFEGGSATN
jgi:hypothetical protein